MEKYEYLGRTLGRYKCVSIRNKDEPIYDDCLSGELGDGTYKAFKVLPSGSEKIFTFNSNKLQTWITQLKVPADPHKQAYWANNPNARHK